MQKHLTLIAAVAALAIALVGCGSSASSDSAASSAAASSETVASSEAAASSAPSSTSLAAASVPAIEEQTNSVLDLDTAFDTLLAANPISNQFEIAAMNIEYDFGLAAEDVVAYKGVKSNDNGDAGLVLVIETPVGKAEAVSEALQAYKEDQVAFYGNYAEFTQAQTNVSNATIGYAENGNAGFVLMVIASNEAADADTISQAAENSIDSVMG